MKNYTKSFYIRFNFKWVHTGRELVNEFLCWRLHVQLPYILQNLHTIIYSILHKIKLNIVRMVYHRSTLLPIKRVNQTWAMGVGPSLTSTYLYGARVQPVRYRALYRHAGVRNKELTHHVSKIQYYIAFDIWKQLLVTYELGYRYIFSVIMNPATLFIEWSLMWSLRGYRYFDSWIGLSFGISQWKLVHKW